MSNRLLFMKLLLAHFVTQSPAEIRVNCSRDVLLECLSFDINSSNFLSLTWYKVSNQTHKEGIIRRSNDQDNPFTHFTRPASFRANHSLFLPDVRPGDTGKYECYVIANVGGQNEDYQVDLIINACEALPNTTNSSQLDEDLPLLWSITGCVAVTFGKIIFSLISIWVIEDVYSRASKRRQYNVSC